MVRGLALLLAVLLGTSRAYAQPRLLVDFEDPTQFKAVATLDARVEPWQRDGNTALRVAFGCTRPYPNVGLQPTTGSAWDLQAYEAVELDITNLDREAIKVGGRVDNPNASGQKNSVGGAVTVEPGATTTLRVEFNRPFAMDLRAQLKGMHHSPWGSRSPLTAVLDPAQVVQIQVYLQQPTREYVIAIDNVRATGHFDPASLRVPEPFFPFVDRYGQYLHQDWPGKIHRDADFQAQRDAEQAAIASHPRPSSWNQYGGWAAGPQLEATGHFRTTKQDGKWHLVDPEGRLFWSLGMCVVKSDGAGSTPITEDRANWFADAPWEHEPALAKYRTEGKVGHGDYAEGKRSQTVVPQFAFYSANLHRKYGPDWYAAWCQLTPQRLMNWGFNTIANWSDDELFKQPRLPYTAWVYINSAKLPWLPGTRNRVSDPFHPMLAQELARRARNMLAKSADDPWCIGVFVDNELTWGDTTFLARAVITGGDEKCYAKVALRDWLQEKYPTIEQFNGAWGSKLASYEAFLAAREMPTTAAGRADVEAFNEVIARKYFQTIRDGLREVAPKKLYLGCRFLAYANEQVVRVAADYVDVLSLNLYRDTIGAWVPPAQVDKPVVVGEFHFGASDRGVFGPGLVRAQSTEQRAQKFAAYVNSALTNPLIVGVHWFALVDEPTSGRTLEGENHGFGFVSITDTPYREMIDAAQQVANQLYDTRSGK